MNEGLLTHRLRLWASQYAHRRAFTFVDFPDLGSPGRHRTLSWGRLLARAETVAAQLDGVARPGDRVALLLPQGLDYVAGFLGCLLARVVAVPLFPPGLPGQEARLAAVLEDCEPACVLVNVASMQATRQFTHSLGAREVPLVLVDGQPTPGTGAGAGAGGGTGAGADVAAQARPEPAPDDLAYLQYTSGSTRTPAGVMISHRNVVQNAIQALTAFTDAPSQSTSVGWLPLFHDMGLLLSVAAPLVGGFPSVLMDPVAFVERPERWLHLLGRYPGVLSAAPNFAYDYCTTRVGPAAVDGLRLDRVHALINGSEPVRPDTMRRFQEAFRSSGLRPEVLCPSYGLAEATVFVAADRPSRPAVELRCRRDALAQGRIAPAGPDRDIDGALGADIQSADIQSTEIGVDVGGDVAVDVPADADAVIAMAACGSPVGQELRIVDPATGAILADGAVGEIVVRGPNVGLGYWKRPEQSAQTFGLLLGEGGADGDPDAGPWLRTGDLGALYEDRLLVTGRLKDLLIVDGRNHYPQDIEQTVQDALDCVRRDRIAVFAAADGAGEAVTAVAEHRRGLTPDGALRDEAASAARARVWAAHGLRLDQLVLVPPGSVPRTSSGKVARSACRTEFLSGGYQKYAQDGQLAAAASLADAELRQEAER